MIESTRQREGDRKREQKREETHPNINKYNRNRVVTLMHANIFRRDPLRLARSWASSSARFRVSFATVKEWRPPMAAGKSTKQLPDIDRLRGKERGRSNQ